MNRDTATALGARAHELRALLVPFISKRVDQQDVDDVVQTVFARIQRGLADLRDGEKLVAWAYQIARNVIVDRSRHAKVREHDRIEHVRSAVASGSEEDAASELALVVRAFIDMLPEPYREALQLAELGGLTQAEAARRAGLSLPGMKSRVQRGRAQLRELLEACCDIELDTRGGIIDIEPHTAPAELPNCCARDVHPSDRTFVSRSMTNKLESTTRTTTSNTAQPSACCGGPAPANTDACCVKDAAAKAAGESGCGCGTTSTKPAPAPSSGCC